MILTIVYFCCALLIYIIDPESVVVYLTILPIQFFFMKMSWKTNNIVLSLFFTYFFIAVGVGTLMLYLDRSSFSGIGTNHVGKFNFSYSYLFTIYAYLFVFQLVIMSLSGIRKSVSSIKLFKLVKIEVNNILVGKSSFSIFPLLITAFIFVIISIWMFYHHLGMIGLKQVELPYHLTGILYYSRRFVFTLILLYLFSKTRNKGIALLILIIYSFLVAVTGSSKSLNLILLIPVGVMCILTGRKKLGIISIVVSCLIYTYVTCTREIVYYTDGQVGILEVFNTANSLFVSEISNGFSYLIHLIAGITGSMYGMKKVVIAYQYTSLDISDTITYLLGSHLSSIISDMPHDLYGVSFSSDKAYGVCVGFPGTMVMMSCRNYFSLIVEALIISCLLQIYDSALNQVLSFKNKLGLKIVVLVLVLFSMMTMIEANTLFWSYAGALFLMIIRLVVKRKIKISKVKNAKIITN